MASTTALSPDFINQLRESLKPVNPTRATIFGSAVEKGQQGKDIDVLVLSQQFDGVRFCARDELIKLPDDIQFDLWLYTPYEFETLCPEGHRFRESIEQSCVNIFSNQSD